MYKMEPEKLNEYSQKMNNIKMHLKALDRLAQQKLGVSNCRASAECFRYMDKP